MKTYRIMVGPYMWVEFSVTPGMSDLRHSRLLGEYIANACAESHKRYGANVEVRVTSYLRTIDT